MMKKFYFLLAALTWLSTGINAQQLELEKTYKISRASKRGSLAGLDYDKDAKTYTLTYFTGQKKNTFKYEQYVFDNDFNFVKDAEFEEEAEVMKKKFKWFRYKGEEYTVVGNTVENNLVGTLVLRKRQITYKYNFLLGGYGRKVELLDKVKPKTDDGNKYTLIANAEDDMNGDLYVLASVKPKAGSKGNEDAGSIRLLKFNAELELVKTTDFEFQYFQSLAQMRTIPRDNPDDPENPGIGGIVFIFAPSDAMGKKMADPNNNNFTYLKVDDNANVTHKFNFQSPASYWRIDEMLAEGNDYYFYGPAMAGRDKYYNVGAGTRMGGGEVKYKAVQLMKVSNGKFTYLTETSLDEFKSKQQFPPSQKKTPDYNGREFGIRSYNLAANGDLIILGQNYDKDKDGNITKYEDALGFHFDTNGKLRAQYGLDTKERGTVVDYDYVKEVGYTSITKITTVFGCPQILIPGDNKMFWVLQEVKGFANGKLLTYPRIGQISLNNAMVSDLTTFGKGEGFYLHPNYPFLETDKGSTLVFFGADKPGRELWFARVKLQ